MSKPIYVILAIEEPPWMSLNQSPTTEFSPCTPKAPHPSDLSIQTKAGLAGLTTNSGTHGFTEILFAFASSFANNGQGFGGLSANTMFYNVMTSIAMMAGRFGLAIPALAFAGLLGRQKITPRSLGTLPTDTLSFGLLLTVFLIVVTAVSYLPVFAIGPVLEHLLFKV